MIETVIYGSNGEYRNDYMVKAVHMIAVSGGQEKRMVVTVDDKGSSDGW